MLNYITAVWLYILTAAYNKLSIIECDQQNTCAAGLCNDALRVFAHINTNLPANKQLVAGMLFLPGIAITFFLAFILLSKNNKSKADKILAAWLAFTGLHLLLYYLYVSKKYVAFPYLLGLEIPLPLVHGPLLFLYAAALTNSGQGKKHSLLHFIPFMLAFVPLVPFFILPAAKKITIYQHEGQGYEVLRNIIFGAIVLSGISYTVVALQMLAKHRRFIAGYFSTTEKINLKWLYYLILGSGIVWVLVIFSVDEYIYSAIVVYVAFIGYFGIKQVGIFTNKSQEAAPPQMPVAIIAPDTNGSEPPALKQPEEDPAIKIKYEKSGLSAGEAAAIHQRLTKLMDQEKLFTNPELTLADLAEKISVHPNTLSQVINTMEQKNFYDYINLQRVEEFKRIIALPGNQKFTLLSLAFECGFNSKTSFNRNFKKTTSLSPTEYLRLENVNLPAEK